MSGKEAGKSVPVVSYISRSLAYIKGYSVCKCFVIDKFLYKVILIVELKKIGKKRGAVCSHRDIDDLLNNVPYELDKYAKELIIFCVALFTFSLNIVYCLINVQLDGKQVIST